MDYVILGDDIDTRDAVWLGANERRQGLYVIGKTGTGKTTLLESLIIQDMEAGQGLCVLDPHGDLIDAVLARVPSSRELDVILLDLADSQYPFGLNLFECKDLADRNLVGRVATHAVEVFEKLWGDISWGPQLAQVLRNCAYTLIENQGYTLAEIRRLLLHDQFRAKLTADLSNPQIREFWELEYDPLRDREQQQLVRSTLNKVDEFLTPAVFPIVGFGRNTVDFREVMDNGRIVLVRLALGKVGERPVSLIGSMIVGQLFNAALSREELPPGQRRQFNLYADEYHRFATPTFAELLAEARKYGLATTLAHQFRGQLTDEANRGATLNAANLVVFAVHGEDAEELAKQFDRTPPAGVVIGQKPKQTTSQDPVHHLLRSGHADANLRYLTQKHLEPLVRAATDTQSGDLFGWKLEGAEPFIDHGAYYANPSDLKTAISMLTTYFVRAMEGTCERGSLSEFEMITEIAMTLIDYLGIHQSYVLDPYGDLRGPQRSWSIVPVPKKTLDILGSFLVYFTDGIVGKSVDKANDGPLPLMVWLTNDALLQVDSSKVPTADHLRVATQRGNRLFNRTVEFLAGVIDMAWSLAEHPILVDSGQWEPIYDRPRSYADVEAEIASSLVSLPKFRARCRLQGPHGPVERAIKTAEFEDRVPSSDADAMLSRIRDRTRANYCAPVDEVLRAIELRKSGSDDGPGTVRRTPL